MKSNRALALITSNPESIDWGLQKIRILMEIGQHQEAQKAYLQLFQKLAPQIAKIEAIGKTLQASPPSTEAVEIQKQAQILAQNIRELTALAKELQLLENPPSPRPKLPFAPSADLEKSPLDDPATRLRKDLLAGLEELLQQDPGVVQWQLERAHLLAELGKAFAARKVYLETLPARPEYPRRAYTIWPSVGVPSPLTALLLVTPNDGNAPLQKYLRTDRFLVLQIITDYHDLRLPLPKHQLIVNAISEADVCQSSLIAALRLVQQSQAPVINHPASIQTTDRKSNAERLAILPGVITPRVALLPRKRLQESPISETLQAAELSFPLLLRSPGFHTGLHFVRAENQDDLAAALNALPGEELLLMEYLDARSPDGKIRKYRVMFVDGRLYPAHLAISRQWKVHYYSAEMADSPEHRAEDQAFLSDMEGVFGTKVMATLQKIQDTLQLDYAGIDFSLSPQNEILLFEANATMRVFPPSEDAKWAYRQAPIAQIEDAVRSMLWLRAQSHTN